MRKSCDVFGELIRSCTRIVTAISAVDDDNNGLPVLASYIDYLRNPIYIHILKTVP